MCQHVCNSLPCFRCWYRPDHGIWDRLASHLPRWSLVSRHVGPRGRIQRLRGREVHGPPSVQSRGRGWRRGRGLASLLGDDVHRVPVQAAPSLLPGQYAGVQTEAVVDGSQWRSTSTSPSPHNVTAPRVSQYPGRFGPALGGLPTSELQVEGE